MIRSRLAAAAVLLALAAGLAPAHPALAHAALVSSSPAAGAAVAKVSQVELRFSEPLVAKLSSASLVSTRMKMGGAMMDHRMAVAGKVSIDPADGRVLRLTFKAPLAAGEYHLDWRAVSKDTHRLKGGFDFTVR